MSPATPPRPARRRAPESALITNTVTIAGLTGLHPRQLVRMAEANVIPGAIKLGRVWRWRRAVVEAWLEGRAAS